MIDINSDISLSDDFKEFGQVGDDFIPDDAKPLCASCLSPCDPLQFYCCKCDSNETINPLASYMPFVRIRFNIGVLGKLWLRILYDKDTSIILRVLFLVLFIFGVLLLPG